MTDLDFTSAADQARLVAAGTASSRELVAHALERIHRLDPQLNTFVHVLDEDALADAAQRDAAPQHDRGPLHGVPIAIKDENDVAGLPTAYGGAAFTTPAARDGEIVRRLRAAGAVIVGKTRMPEFGIWPYTETSANGYTRNPWNPLRSPAGSSGGTAAAVASGMVPAGIGGDGGGSIRLPSSWCGLYGLKCQRGRTSASPATHLWRSLGVIGPLTRTVEDSALIYDVLTGNLPTDAWTAEPLPETLTQAYHSEPRPLRIAVTHRGGVRGLRADDETLAALDATATALCSLGHSVTETDPPFPNVSLPFTVQVAAGVSDEAARAEHPTLLEHRTRTLLRLTAPLRGRVAWAEKAGIEAGRRFADTFFSRFDLILMPTTASAAVPVGQLDGVGAVAASQRSTQESGFTALWNVLGNPAAAIPSGFSRDGLPLSVQLVGGPNAEPDLIRVSAQLERTRPWADRRPPIS
jgi:amidase